MVECDVEVRRFRLLMRCANCKREHSRALPVPQVEDAPTDVDELLESALLARQPFFCKPCDGIIGILVGAALMKEDA